LSLIGATFLVSSTSATVYKEPPPTLDPKPYTTWQKSKLTSKRGEINIPFTNTDGSSDSVNMIRLDLVGDSATRGYAHGYLLAKEIIEFTGPKLTQFYRDQIGNADVSQYPEPLQTILKDIQKLGKLAAPAVFTHAMKWVWDSEVSFIPAAHIAEMDAMGVGICDSPFAPEKCDPVEWSDQIKAFNMFPELIKMACTAYGAWGDATGGNGLVQVRALDFGGGPFANYTVIQVHREDPDSDPFVSVSFPSFVGVITGVSSSGVGISEKVWMMSDSDPNLKPGSYQGEADVFVLRDVLQYAKNKADAVSYIQSANRTWGMWVGIGDYATQTLDLVGYEQAQAPAYTDETMPSMTGQPYLKSVAYVDKHTQPDSGNLELPNALTDFYGNISLETSKIICQTHTTGDLHMAFYDFTAKVMYVAIGKVNSDGDYMPEGGTDDSVWKAYNRPSVKFSLPDLWAGI